MRPLERGDAQRTVPKHLINVSLINVSLLTPAARVQSHFIKNNFPKRPWTPESPLELDFYLGASGGQHVDPSQQALVNKYLMTGDPTARGVTVKRAQQSRANGAAPLSTKDIKLLASRALSNRPAKPLVTTGDCSRCVHLRAD